MSKLDQREVWSDGPRTLYHGDSRKLAPLLPTASFDAIVTDAPYGEGLVTGDESPERSAELLRDVLQACLPALKPAAHVCFFWSSRSVHLAINAGTSAGLDFKRLLFMHVQQATARPYRGWLPRVQPIVLMRLPGRKSPEWRVATATAIRQAMRKKGYTSTSLARELGVNDRLVSKWYRLDDEHWSYPNPKHREVLGRLLGISIPPPAESQKFEYRHDLYQVHGKIGERHHPCQKPTSVTADIMSRLGRAFLDPFAGSATSLVAARSIDAKCVGLEIDRQHCKRAARRLDALTKAPAYTAGITEP